VSNDGKLRRRSLHSASALKKLNLQRRLAESRWRAGMALSQRGLGAGKARSRAPQRAISIASHCRIERPLFLQAGLGLRHVSVVSTPKAKGARFEARTCGFRAPAFARHEIRSEESSPRLPRPQRDHGRSKAMRLVRQQLAASGN